MIGFRLLSLIAITVFSTILAWTGTTLLSLSAFGWYYIPHAIAAAISVLAILAALNMIGLSFFAIERASDGAFVINRSTRYGRLFFWIGRKTGVDLDIATSYCPLFWKTNLCIMTGVMILALAIIGTACITVLSYLAITNMKTVAFWIGWIIGGIIALIVIVTLCAKLNERVKQSEWAHRRRERRRERSRRPRPEWRFALEERLDALWSRLEIAGYIALTLFLLAAAIAVIYLSFTAWPMLMITLVGMVVACIAGDLIWDNKLKDTQFGATLESFYKNRMCPRIRVE